MGFYCFEAFVNEVSVEFGRRSPLGRFLLKAMQHIESVGELDRIDRPIRGFSFKVELYAKGV